ncbi:lipopolysaccharide biosynthesis protein [Jeotgalicoccus sp. FSL K6-3177]|uniref:lipopolysaccharide biosynthesis protein n=1 Tax=Jeotgalicoccus sp. FSL K6-3177 TaxID=2921494 RepID=UPI0030FD77DD
MIIVKFGTSHDLGIYTVVISIITPISVFLGFQLRNQLAVDSSNSLEIKTVFSLRNTLNIIFIMVTTLIYIFTNITIILVFALFKIVDSYLEIIYGLLLRDSKNHRMGRLLSIKSLINLFVFAILYVFTNDLLLTMIVQLIVLVVILFIFIRMNSNLFDNANNSNNENSIRTILIKTTPLAISALLISLTPQIPRYFIGIFDSVEMVGIFSSLAYLIVVGTLFINSINSSFYNEYSKLIAEGKYNIFIKQLMKNAGIYLVLWLLMCTAIIIFNENLLVTIFNEEFSYFYTEFLIIALSSIFLFISTLFINFTLFTKKYLYQLYIYIIVNVFSIIISYILIDMYGITGAAFSLGATYLVQLIVSFLFFVMIFRGRKNNEK